MSLYFRHVLPSWPSLPPHPMVAGGPPRTGTRCRPILVHVKRFTSYSLIPTFLQPHLVNTNLNHNTRSREREYAMPMAKKCKFGKSANPQE